MKITEITATLTYKGISYYEKSFNTEQRTDYVYVTLNENGVVMRKFFTKEFSVAHPTPKINNVIPNTAKGMLSFKTYCPYEERAYAKRVLTQAFAAVLDDIQIQLSNLLHGFLEETYITLKK